MRRTTALLLALIALSPIRSSPASDAESAAELRYQAERAINNLKSCDSALTNFFEHSAGYAVFPNVRSNSTNAPATDVKGILYERGKPVGQAVLLELNAERMHPLVPFHETIFFATAQALDQFKQNGLTITVDSGAVSASEGAALTARYRHGVAVFVVPKSGLLEDIFIGDQNVWFKPLTSPVTLL